MLLRWLDEVERLDAVDERHRQCGRPSPRVLAGRGPVALRCSSTTFCAAGPTKRTVATRIMTLAMATDSCSRNARPGGA